MNSIRTSSLSKPMLWIGSGFGLLLVLVATSAIYLGSRSDEWWRDLVTTILSQTLEREVEIQGEFRLQLGRIITTEASSVRISNPDWAGSRDMLRLGSLELEFDSLSALKETLLIHRLTLTDIDLALEVNQEGRNNWEFTAETKPPSANKPSEDLTLPVHVELFSLQHAHLRIIQSRWERPLILQVDTITGDLSPNDNLVLGGSGQLGELPFLLKGSLGKISSMLNKGPIAYQLNGNLGDTRLRSKGSFNSLAAPLRPLLDLSFNGPDFIQITQALGSPKIAEGPFEAHINIMPGGRGVSSRVQGKFGMLQLDAEITADELGSIKNMDVMAHLSGENLTALSNLLGLPPLPKGSFEINADLHGDNSNTHIKKITASVGKHRISFSGIVGTWPELLGTQIELHADGPDLAAFTPTVAVLGLGELPSGAYAANALIEPSEMGLYVRSSKLTVDDFQITAAGQVLTKDQLRAELHVTSSGPDLSVVSRLVDTVQLPAWPFQAKGKIEITGEDITIIGASGTAERHKITVDGPIAFSLAGPIRLDVKASGPSLEAVLQGLGFDAIPAAAAYQVEGKLQIANKRLDVTAKHARLGPVKAAAILSIPDLHNPNSLMIDVGKLTTTDISTALGLVGMQLDLPQVMPANLSGQIKRTKDSTRLTKVRGSIGTTSINVDGMIGNPPDNDKTAVSLSIIGANLAQFLTHPIEQEIPFQIEGSMAMDKNNPRFENMQLKLANIEAHVHGDAGDWKSMTGAELSVSAQAPNTDIIASILNRSLPAGSVKFDSQIRTAKDVLYFDQMNAQLGPSNLSGDLKLIWGKPLRLIGKLSSSYLDFALFQKEAKSEHAAVTKTNVIRNNDSTEFGNTALPQKKQVLLLPDSSIELEMIDQLDQDSGILSLFQKEAESEQIPKARTQGTRTIGSKGTSNTAQPKKGQALLFPDTPFELETFDRFDLDLGIHISEVANLWKLDSLHDLTAKLRLKGRDLSVSGLEVRGKLGGIIKGDLIIAGNAELTHINVDITGEQLRLGLAAAPGQGPETYPPTDIEAKFTAAGNTYRELATSVDGRVKVVQGEGRVNNNSIHVLLSDVLYELFRAVNPLAKTEPLTRLNCSVYILNLEEGKVDIQAVVIQTDKLTIVSAGTIDLNRERINVDFATRPRKGVGISASTLTNAYTKLGGTLSKPTIELDPGRATLATGAAVATGGLSFLYKGIWDRYFSPRDPCRRALERDAELQMKKAKQP